MIAYSGGTAGVVIFYDSEFHIAVEKAQAMKAEIQKRKRCSVLAMENVPIREAQTRMPVLAATLVRRYGTKLTDMLAINGNYFAGSGAALLALGISGSAPPFAVAAGDGDASEFARIRSGNYQAASVAEPLYLQGWQLIDEINRALAHQPASHYPAPPRLITKADVPSGGVFDPSTSYRQDYRRLWGRLRAFSRPRGSAVGRRSRRMSPVQRDRGPQRGAPARLARDPQRPSECLHPVAQPEQARPLVGIGASDPIVADCDLDGRIVGGYLDRHGRRVSMLADVSNRLGDHKVRRHLGRNRKPIVDLDLEFDRHGCPPRQRLERRLESALGQDCRMDPA